MSQIYIDDKISQYIVDIVNATRKPADCGLNDLAGLIAFGGSPRASIGLALASRSYAFLKGRGYVLPEDVRAVCHDVLRHRIGLTYEAEANEITSDEHHQQHTRQNHCSLVLTTIDYGRQRTFKKSQAD